MTDVGIHNPTDHVESRLLQRDGEHVVVGIDDAEEHLYVEVDGVAAYFDRSRALKLHTKLVDHQLYEAWPEDMAQEYIDYVGDLIDVIDDDLAVEDVRTEWDHETLEVTL